MSCTFKSAVRRIQHIQGDQGPEPLPIRAQGSDAAFSVSDGRTGHRRGRHSHANLMLIGLRPLCGRLVRSSETPLGSIMCDRVGVSARRPHSVGGSSHPGRLFSSSVHGYIQTEEVSLHHLDLANKKMEERVGEVQQLPAISVPQHSSSHISCLKDTFAS